MRTHFDFVGDVGGGVRDRLTSESEPDLELGRPPGLILSTYSNCESETYTTPKFDPVLASQRSQPPLHRPRTCVPHYVNASSPLSLTEVALETGFANVHRANSQRQIVGVQVKTE